MPFTFSHPAIVLPLAHWSKRWFSLSGLIIGSLTPDFEYFIRMRIQSDYSHTIAGLFWFDLPLGLALFFIFHSIVRNSLIDHLPLFLKSRFWCFKTFNWVAYFKQHWIVVSVSIFIGAISHLFWDSFTHDTGYFVQTIPLLKQSITLFDITIPVLKIAQHCSSIIGTCSIIWVVLSLPKNKETKKSIDFKYWIIVILLLIIIISIRLVLGLKLQHYGNVIVTCISALLMSLIMTPLLMNKNIRKSL